MRRVFLLAAAAAAAAACSPEPRRPFPIGFLKPVSSRVAAAAGALGVGLAERAPAGAAAIPAGVPGAGGEVTADWARLRFLAARAVAEGAIGVFFRLPGTPSGRDYLDYAEESQSVDRVLRELLAVRPILESGPPAAPPFAVPPGIEARAWTHAGRGYVLLVNVSGAPAPLELGNLESWRALFAVRSDARESLRPCGPGLCLPAEGVLWLEGRLLAGGRR